MSESPSVDGALPEVELQRRSRLAARIAIPVAIVLLGLIIVLAVSDTQRNQLGRGELIGEVAPPVTGTTLAGEEFDIDDQRGRWVVVNFFASWCPPCRREHPELEQFTTDHANGDAVVVGVAMADSADDVQTFFDELGGDWPAIPSDTTSEVIDYAVSAPPTTFVVAPSGIVVEQIVGPVTAGQLETTIARYTSPEVEG